MLGKLRAWWRRGGRPETRLSPEAARAIPDAAMTGDWDRYAGRMTVASARLQEGRLLWRIGSATIGSGVIVTIDDATGTVLERRGWGLR